MAIRYGFRKIQDLLDMLLPQLERKPLGRFGIELGGVNLVQPDHNPPVIQRLWWPQLTGLTDLE